MEKIAFLFLIVIFGELTLSYSSEKVNSSVGCILEERDALLKFKASLFDPLNTLASWNVSNSNECCTWKGVRCENITGHVISLNVSNRGYEYGTHGLQGKSIDSSLLDLTHLSFLDVSNNDFGGSTIPAFLGSLDHLQQLYLRYANFDGVIPDNLGNLSMLVEIDLSGNKLSGSIPTSVGNLSLLKYLNFRYNQLSGTIPLHIGNLSLLTDLYLDGNTLSDTIPSTMGNLRALGALDLSDNQISEPIPYSVGNLRALKLLDLSSNQLSGPIPHSVGNLSALTDLSLDNNHLTGEIPISLGQLSHLENLFLHSNYLSSTISEAHFANLSVLSTLNLGSNSMLKLNMSIDWVPPFQLHLLYLGPCESGGQFPRWLRTQKDLRELDLSECNIWGTLPGWLREIRMSNLKLSYNYVSGPISNLPFGLKMAYLSSNKINHLPNNISNILPQLTHLFLAQNRLSGPILDSLCKLDLRVLDIANNSLSGNIPECLANLSSLSVLRLALNNLSGIIDLKSFCGSNHLGWLLLSSNRFTGVLPTTFEDCGGLQTLDIGDNMISGELPEWIGLQLTGLKVLRMKNNQFYGNIPLEFCQLSQLMIVDLANNKLTGEIPHCVGNFSGMVMNGLTRPRLDSYLFDNSPAGVTEIIKGSPMEYISSNDLFVVNMDLSNNNLIGVIPSELTTLSALNGLNLSHNRLEGNIPNEIGDLKSLESLDLSNNKLFGEIPQRLSELASLSYLNLSYNNLSGHLPTGVQIQSLIDEHPSIFDGNPGLCGSLLLKKCQYEAPNVNSHGEEDDDTIDKVMSYAIISSGFATGFWGIIGFLVFKRNWRDVFFKFVGRFIEGKLGATVL